jgi:hypothetical protein
MKMITCSHCAKEFDYAAQTETSAGTVACPHCGKSVSQPLEGKADSRLLTADNLPLAAKYSSAEFDGEPPSEFMYMPGGVHTVWLSRGGKPAQVTVNVTPQTAAVIQEKFLALQASRKPQRPYFDFEHHEEDASAWPVGFAWKNAPEPGVYVNVEWSLAGKNAVAGKSQRAFSPVFFADAEFPQVPIHAKEVTIPAGKRGSAANPADVTGLGFCAGSLTNEPAFRKILPLWAKDSAARASETSETKPQLPQTAAEGADSMTPEEIAALQAKAAAQEAELVSLKAKEVTGAIARAIERGAIEPKNEALKAKYAKIGDVELIDALPGKDTDALQARATKPVIEVGKPGISESLKGFRGYREKCGLLDQPLAAKEAAREAGAIYAREIRPVIEGDGMLPLKATDTLVTDIVSQRVLDFLRYEFPLLRAISTNFSDEQLKIGQNVITRLVTPPDVVDYNTSTGWPNSTTAAADISVPMTAQKAVQIMFQSNQLSGTNRRLFDEQAAPAAYSIKKDCVDLVLALITTAFTNTAVVKALVDWDRKGVIALKNGMKKAQIPMFNPFALLSIDYYDKLAEDGSIVSIALPESAQAMKTGILPRIHGLQPIEAQNEAWANNIVGFGGIPSALALATALPVDYTTVFPGVNAGGQVRIVTDAETGLSLMEVKFINHQLADASMRLAYMRGAARGPVTHGVLLKSA